jgi:hypothetical protein
MNGLTLNRHNQLISYNNYVNTDSVRNYVFECHLTVDERYFVLQDEVFDIQEQTKLGNIWSSLDIFKTIFKNVNVDNPEYREIQESWANLPILENEGNLYKLRDYLLEWNFFTDTWVGRKAADAGKGIVDFAKSSYEGTKKLIGAISQGQWSEILTLLGKGVLFILRKLKDAAYSMLGIVVDAILVATGIGKGVQIAVWGLITALDVYQIAANDWPADDDREDIWKYLDLGFDLLGLVFAGVAAKGARAIFKPLTGLSTKNMAIKVAQSAKMKSIIQQMLTAVKSGGGKLKSLQALISKKWPAGANFINKAIGMFAGLVKKFETYLTQILSKSNLKGIQNAKPTKGWGYIAPVKTGGEFIKRAAVATGVAGGLQYGIEKLTGSDAQDDFQAFGNSNVKPEFDYNDI